MLLKDKYKPLVYMKDGVGYCSKCRQTMIGLESTVSRHKRMCGHNFLKETVKDESIGFICEATDDELSLFFLKPVAFFEGQMFELTWKLILELQFGLKEKRMSEIWCDKSIDENLMKNENFIDLNACDSIQEIVNYYFNIPFLNLKFLMDFYKKEFPIQKTISKETAETIFFEDLQIPENYEVVDNVVVGKVFNENDTKIFRISVFDSNYREKCRFLIGDKFFYTNEPVRVRLLLMGSKKSLLESEDLMWILKDMSLEQVQYWNDYNVMYALLSQFFPLLDRIIKMKMNSLAKNFFWIDGERFVEVFSETTLSALQDSAFFYRDLLYILLKIKAYTSEILEVNKITYIWIKHLKDNVIPLFEGRRTEISNLSAKNIALINKTIYNLQFQTEDDSELMNLYLNFIQELNQ